jgi:hypothetical protein
MIVGERGREVTLVPRSLPQREPRGGSHCGTGLGRACGGGPTRLWAGSCMAAASATTDIMRCARAVVATANSPPRRAVRVAAAGARDDGRRAARARRGPTRDSRCSTRASRARVRRSTSSSIASWGADFTPFNGINWPTGPVWQGKQGASGRQCEWHTTGRVALPLASSLARRGPGRGRGCAAAGAVAGAGCWCRALRCAVNVSRDVTAHISLTFRSGALDMAPRCTHTHMLSRHNRWDPDRTR